MIPGLVGGESDRVYPDARTPRPLEILSHAASPAAATRPPAQSVYYTAGSGAGVFTAGTLRWGCALVDRCDRPLGRRPRFARGHREPAARVRRGPGGCGTRPGQRRPVRPAAGQRGLGQLRRTRTGRP